LKPRRIKTVVGHSSLVVGQKRSSLKRSELWFLKGNQTRAGRPARVKVCKDQSIGRSFVGIIRGVFANDQRLPTNGAKQNQQSGII